MFVFGVLPFMVAGYYLGHHGPPNVQFWGGVLFGFGTTVFAWLWQTPPQFVENWKEGSDGERRTEGVLRPLAKEGWVFHHDLPGRWGNRDHVAVGRPGIFLIDSKAPAGRVEADRDRLIVHRLGQDSFDYTVALGDGLRRAAGDLRGSCITRSVTINAGSRRPRPDFARN